MSLYINSSIKPSAITLTNINVPSGSVLFISGTISLSGSAIFSLLSVNELDANTIVATEVRADTVAATNLYGTASYALTASYLQDPLNLQITGSNSQLLFNKFNTIGTSPNLTFNTSTNNLNLTGSLNMYPSNPAPTAGGLYFDGTDWYFGY